MPEAVSYIKNDDETIDDSETDGNVKKQLR